MHSLKIAGTRVKHFRRLNVVSDRLLKLRHRAVHIAQTAQTQKAELVLGFQLLRREDSNLQPSG